MSLVDAIQSLCSPQSRRAPQRANRLHSSPSALSLKAVLPSHSRVTYSFPRIATVYTGESVLLIHVGRVNLHFHPNLRILGTMWTIPCRRIGNLLVIFAGSKIYSTHPWKRAAAFDAVCRNEELREYRGHLRYNLAVIK